MKRFKPIGIFTLTIALATLLILPAAQAVDFKISGQINRAVLWGDNGNDNDVKFVDNDNSSTRFRFTGGNDFGEMWRVGIVWENQMESNSSASTAIDIGENGDSTDVTFTERKMEFYVEHKSLGKLSLGQGDTASNGTSEVDLSGTAVVTYSGITDMNGGFNFRDDDDSVITNIGSAFSNYDGLSRRDRIRYDSPKFWGFWLATSYQNGQSWDAALRSAHEWQNFGKLAAAIAIVPGGNQRNSKQYNGSISFLHNSGLNLTFSHGQRPSDDGKNLYGKLGYKFGKWAISGDYTWSENVGADGDTARSIGAGVVWNIWESIQFYGGYRWNDLDRDAAERPAGVGNAESINSVMVGGRVKF